MANSDNTINIGDIWKGLVDVQINIGDSWKSISEGYINIGDAWKQWWSAAAPRGDRGLFWAGYA